MVIIKTIAMSKIRRSFIAIWMISLLALILQIAPENAHAGLLRAKSELKMMAEEDYFYEVQLNREMETKLTISYSWGRLAIPAGYFLLRPSPTRIDIEIASKPSWCEVELEKKNLSAEMSMLSIFGGNVTLETRVRFRIVSKDAPGLEEGRIVLVAVAEKNGNINSSSASCEIVIVPAFYPDVEVDNDYFSLILSPGEERELEVEVENRGNMEIVASIELAEELPELVSIDTTFARSIDIDPGEKKILRFRVKIERYEKEIEERYIIPLELSYFAKGHEELKGESIGIDLDLRIKGQPKPIISKDTMVIIEGVVILVLLIALIAVIVRCRR